MEDCLNPYFIGLPILIRWSEWLNGLFFCRSQSLFYWITYSYGSTKVYIRNKCLKSQSLFYWITYSYKYDKDSDDDEWPCLNPYFIGLPILIRGCLFLIKIIDDVSILILLDYLFLFSSSIRDSINRCVVSILILLDYLFL